jgi:putative addiction module antidote
MFMSMKLKLRSVGTSTGILLPKEMLVRMKIKRNDTIFAVETPEGYLLTPYDPEVDRQLSKGREFMAKYRDTFRALAK